MIHFKLGSDVAIGGVNKKGVLKISQNSQENT